MCKNKYYGESKTANKHKHTHNLALYTTTRISVQRLMYFTINIFAKMILQPRYMQIFFSWLKSATNKFTIYKQHTLK